MPTVPNRSSDMSKTTCDRRQTQSQHHTTSGETDRPRARSNPGGGIPPVSDTIEASIFSRVLLSQSTPGVQEDRVDLLPTNHIGSRLSISPSNPAAHRLRFHGGSQPTGGLPRVSPRRRSSPDCPLALGSRIHGWRKNPVTRPD